MLSEDGQMRQQQPAAHLSAPPERYAVGDSHSQAGMACASLRRLTPSAVKMLSYGARRLPRPACASNCEQETTVPQQAHRMPDAPLGLGSMRTAPFSSSSPWLVMYATGSPSCRRRNERGHKDCMPWAQPRSLVTASHSLVLKLHRKRLKPSSAQAWSFSFLPSLPAVQPSQGLPPLRRPPIVHLRTQACLESNPQGTKAANARVHLKPAGLVGQEEALVLVGVALAPRARHAALRRRGHVHAPRAAAAVVRAARWLRQRGLGRPPLQLPDGGSARRLWLVGRCKLARAWVAAARRACVAEPVTLRLHTQQSQYVSIPFEVQP